MGNTYIWTEANKLRLVKLARAGVPVSAMMGEFSCSESSIRGQINKYAASLSPAERAAFWHEREARHKGQPRMPSVVPAAQPRRDHTNITAAFFGDPPPGSSALDKRNAASRGL